MTTAYTWGHFIDETSQTINRGGCAARIRATAARAERADSINDIRHRLVAGYVWDLPGLKRFTGVAKVVLGRWQTGGIVTLQRHDIDKAVDGLIIQTGTIYDTNNPIALRARCAA